MPKQLWYKQYRPDNLVDYVCKNDELRGQLVEWVMKSKLPHVVLEGPPGTGKAQPLDSLIATPIGWMKMGDIRVGQEILTPRGVSAKVIGVFPQGEKEVFKIKFSDGRNVECCSEHLWEVSHKDWGMIPRVIPLESFMDKANKVGKNPKGRARVKVRLTEPMEWKKKNHVELPVNPYVLGCLLGDGYLPEKGCLQISTADQELVESMENAMGGKILLARAGQYDYRLVVNPEKRILNSTNPLKERIKELGLLGKRSDEKFIPEVYKFSSVEERRELIRGMMDTDGTVSSNNTSISYCTTSKQLAKDFQEIIWSLGGIANISERIPTYYYKGEKKDGKMAYNVHVRISNPEDLFRLERKILRCGSYQYSTSLANSIVSIESSGKKNTQCILIDDPEHLYLTNGGIPTHNTTLAMVLKNELKVEDGDFLFINSSLKSGIDTIRTDIVSFAENGGWGGTRLIVLDEADRLSLAAQDSLRGVMDAYGGSVRFIFTCNRIQGIAPALRSRCQIVTIDALEDEEFILRLATILIEEGYDAEGSSDTLIELHKMFYPDLRKAIDTLQDASGDDKIVTLREGGASGANDWEDELMDIVSMDNAPVADVRQFAANLQGSQTEQALKHLYDNPVWVDRRNLDLDTEREAYIVIAQHLALHKSMTYPDVNLVDAILQIQRLRHV